MNCPLCGGEGTELGELGNRLHLRCRNCGIDYSRRIGEAAQVLVHSVAAEDEEKAVRVEEPHLEDLDDD